MLFIYDVNKLIDSYWFVWVSYFDLKVNDILQFHEHLTTILNFVLLDLILQSKDYTNWFSFLIILSISKDLEHHFPFAYFCLIIDLFIIINNREIKLIIYTIIKLIFDTNFLNFHVFFMKKLN